MYYGRGGKWDVRRNVWSEEPEVLSLELPAEGVKDVRLSGAEDFERRYTKALRATQPCEPEPEPAVAAGAAAGVAQASAWARPLSCDKLTLCHCAHSEL